MNWYEYELPRACAGSCEPLGNVKRSCGSNDPKFSLSPACKYTRIDIQCNIQSFPVFSSPGLVATATSLDQLEGLNMETGLVRLHSNQCKLATKCATRNASAKGRDRPFDSTVKVWLMAIDKDIDKRF